MLAEHPRLQALAAAPIPIVAKKNDSNAARGIGIRWRSRRFREGLCYLDECALSCESYYAIADGFNPPYRRSMPGSLARVQARRSVAQRLVAVDAFLRPLGLAVHVWDGFRPLPCQKALWDYFMQLARSHLGPATDQELYKQVARYCSDPNRFDPRDPTTWPAHLTGGAIDLTLRRVSTGETLFMGSIFDDASPISHTDAFEIKAKTPGLVLSQSDREALKNRRILYHAMLRHGFSNFHYEWWHYDWGNQFWALNATPKAPRGKPRLAYYGPAQAV